MLKWYRYLNHIRSEAFFNWNHLLPRLYAQMLYTCSSDMSLTYYGMSTWHLITRAREHLNFKSMQRSAIKDHIISCNTYSNVKYGMESFTIIRKCQSEYRTKIHDSLLIKNMYPNSIVNFMPVEHLFCFKYFKSVAAFFFFFFVCSN